MVNVKEELSQIVGRTITGVYYQELKAGGGYGPQTKLFLSFEDGTSYEVYTSREDISTTSGVCWLTEGERFSGENNKSYNTVFEAVLSPGGTFVKVKKGTTEYEESLGDRSQ
jgi:hypothetical protein